MRLTTCARCGGPLPPAAPTGRPRVTCSDACKKAIYRTRTTELAQQARAATAAKAAKKAAGHRDAWWTPADLRARMHSEHMLGLDAAACAESTLVPGAWLGPTHDDPARRDALAFEHWAGLVRPGETVWLNPPYTPAPLIQAFLAKAALTAKNGVRVVALVPAATSTKWFHAEVFGHPSLIEWLDKRVRYIGPHDTGGTPLWGSALVTYIP